MDFWLYTVLKLQNHSVTQILREINFESAILAYLDFRDSEL